jgi:hypothetical protein
MAKEEKEEKTTEQSIQDDLEINVDDLAKELLDQPSRFFYWSVTWARAARARRRQRLATRELEARLTKEFRELMANTQPGVRVTEKMIEDFLYGHPVYKQQSDEQIKTEYAEDMLSVAKDALKERYGALTELIRNQKEEAIMDTAGAVEVMRDEITNQTAQREEKKTKKGKKEN